MDALLSDGYVGGYGPFGTTHLGLGDNDRVDRIANELGIAATPSDIAYTGERHSVEFTATRNL